MVYDWGSPAPCSDSGLMCWSWDRTSAEARLGEPDTFASQVEDGALRLPRDTARTLWSWLLTQCPSHSWTSWFLSTDFWARNALQSRNPEELRQTPVIDNTSALICLLFCTVHQQGLSPVPPPAASPLCQGVCAPVSPPAQVKGAKEGKLELMFWSYKARPPNPSSAAITDPPQDSRQVGLPPACTLSQRG